MKRVALSFAVLVALFFALPTAPAGADPIANENRFVALINQLRASKGLGQLTPDPGLQSVARNWSAVMGRTQTLAHNPSFPKQVTSNWIFLGENVGTGPTVEELHQAFIRSPKHYQNLVEPRFHLVGIGIVEVNGIIWVTENFEQREVAAAVNQAAAQPAAAPKPATAPAPKAAPAPAAPVVAPTTTAAPPSDAPMAAADDDRRGAPAPDAEVEGVAFDRGPSPTRIALWGAGPLMALVLILVVITRRRRRKPLAHGIKI